MPKSTKTRAPKTASDDDSRSLQAMMVVLVITYVWFFSQVLACVS
jgi:hypothetical protein